MRYRYDAEKSDRKESRDGNPFPDAPISQTDASRWQRNVGKPLTMAEKRRIFGKATMVDPKNCKAVV